MAATDKSALVAKAMKDPHRLPSYEAWAMTIPELTDLVGEIEEENVPAPGDTDYTNTTPDPDAVPPVDTSDVMPEPVVNGTDGTSADKSKES